MSIKAFRDCEYKLPVSDHEHAAPLGVVERSLHHEQLHRLRWVTRQELDQRLPERTASLEPEGREIRKRSNSSDLMKAKSTFFYEDLR